MLTVSWGTMTVAFHRSVVVCAVHTHTVTCAAAPRLTARNSDDVLIQTTESEVTFFFLANMCVTVEWRTNI